MALDRESIEKRDFPIGRRGYDPQAVDAHLRQLAGEIGELKRSARQRTESLAAAASEQVRSIAEAAETSAAEIQRQAEDNAREIRAEATSAARAARQRAAVEAREHVGRVSQSTASMLLRLDTMQSELNALIEGVRTRFTRLNGDLQLLEGELSSVEATGLPRPQFDRALEPAPAADAELRAGRSAGAAAMPEGANGSENEEGARLVALSMAMDGKSREETDSYLAEHFRLTERRKLLDDVYAAFGG